MLRHRVVSICGDGIISNASAATSSSSAAATTSAAAASSSSSSSLFRCIYHPTTSTPKINCS